MRDAQIVELKEKLSKGHDILGRDQYANSAVLVPLVYIKGEQHLLFEKRAQHIKQGSEVCFPGGHFDKKRDSSFLSTALRETNEELGIGSDSIDIIGQLDTLVSPRGVIVEIFLGCVELDDLSELELDRSEVEEAFTVPLSWFLKNPPEIYHNRVEIQSSFMDEHGKVQVLLPVDKLGLPALYKKNRSEWMPRVTVYKREPDIIWGLTAAIVHNLVTKVLPGEQQI
jgi:coenzyme A diphosphatase NUDT7